MKVLIACEYSGTVRDAFLRKGHDAWSCDILPSESDKGPHIQGDVLDILNNGWDLMIAHPPCTHLSVSGAKHFHKKKKRQKRALEFFVKMLEAPIHSICVENPVCVASTKLKYPPTQIIQPWMFGDSFQKTTCLWLKNLPPLKPTKYVDKGEFVVFNSGRKLPKWYSESKGKERSRTFKGIAKAMADQWSEKFESFDFELGII